MPAFKDISGRRFGSVVAMWPAGYKGPRRDIMYLCQCDCGERVPIRNGHLRNGIAKSCGCKSKRGVHGPRTLHGMTRTPELAAYCGAIVRCTKPKALRWKHYGGRGIEFRFKSFAEFFAELGPKPEPKHLYSLDRFPNNDGHYEKGKVRWATAQEQNSNRNCCKKKKPTAEVAG
jgi:hypothetical protein